MSHRPLVRPTYRLMVLAGTLMTASVLALPTAQAAQAPVGLGTADSFGVLAGAGITNTGPTTITGNLGTFPTASETGMGSVTLHGTNHDGDAVTQHAKPDLVTAYNDAAGRSPVTNVATELGGTTLKAGVYQSPTLGLTGTLTLDAEGNPNAQFIFLADSTLITASNSHVDLINGAVACNVVWKVGSSATFGTGTSFVGTVLSHTSITAQTAATFEGRLLARTGAVTLDTNTITRPTCAGVLPTPSPSPSPSHSHKPTPTPKPTHTHKPTATPKPTPHHTPTPKHTHGPKPTQSRSSHPSPSPTAPSHHSPGGDQGRGHGGDTGRTPSITSTSLAFTGLPVQRIGAVGAGLVLAGILILMAARARRRPRGDHLV